MEKVIVYGLGFNFIKNYQRILIDYQVIGLADKVKAGDMCQGFKVLSPEDILEIDYDFIIVTPNVYKEIVNDLEGIGIRGEKIKALNELYKSDNVGSSLKVCFFIKTKDVGEFLISLNYICGFTEKYSRYEALELYIGFNKKLDEYYQLIIESFKININSIFAEKIEDIGNKFDVLVSIDRYPEVIKVDKYKISRLCPDIFEYIQICEKFSVFNPRYFLHDLTFYGNGAMHEEMQERGRIKQPDVYAFLGIEETPLIKLKDDTDTLKKYGLEDKEFITFSSGMCPKDIGENNTKEWKTSYFNKLIKEIQELYAGKKIVVIGESSQYKVQNNNVYHFDELKSANEIVAVLKHAYLHFDIDDELVHIRHFAGGGKSVVLFGPTSPRFYGYTENINIRSNKCLYPCEGAIENWDTECLIESSEKNICMNTILPSDIVDRIKREGLV